MRLNRILPLFLISCLISSCDIIDYHPYDVLISGETDVNAHNIEKIEKNCREKTTIRFVTMGDSQRWYDETEDFVKHLNQRDDIDFVIHGGDISDFGLTDEFLWQRDIMNAESTLCGHHRQSRLPWYWRRKLPCCFWRNQFQFHCRTY